MKKKIKTTKNTKSVNKAIKLIDSFDKQTKQEWEAFNNATSYPKVVKIITNESIVYRIVRVRALTTFNGVDTTFSNVLEKQVSDSMGEPHWEEVIINLDFLNTLSSYFTNNS
jgi:hypothetical protein